MRGPFLNIQGRCTWCSSLAVLVACGVWTAASADTMLQPAIALRHLGEAQGLSRGAIGQIVQDGDGYLWVSGEAGVFRFDGYEFLRVSGQGGLPEAPQSPGALALATEPGGTLWAWGRGIVYRQTTPLEFESFESGLDTGFGPLLVASDGVVWAGTWGDGLLRFDPDREEFLLVELEQHPGAAYVSNLLEGTDGSLWVGTPTRGLFRLAGEMQMAERIPHPGDAHTDGSEFGVFAMAADGDSALWIGTDLGLDRFEPATGRYVQFESAPGALPDRVVGGIAQLGDGHLLLALPRYGLADFDPSNGSVQAYPASTPSNAGPLGTGAHTLFADREGGIWVGSDRGLSRYEPGARRFRLFPRGLEGSDWPGFDAVTHLYEDRAHRLWVGAQAGLATPSEKGGWRIYKADGDRPDHPKNAALSFLQDSRGRYWVGAAGQLHRLDPDTGFHHARALHQGWIAMAEAPDGTLWLAGLGEGLARLRADAEDIEYFFDPEPPLDGQDPLCAYRAADGTIWFGTAAGLIRVRDNEMVELRARSEGGPPAPVFDIAQGPGESLWLASGAGLVRFLPGTGVVQGPVGAPPLDSLVASHVELDTEGRLWLGTPRGLVLYDPGADRAFGYGPDDGLPGDVTGPLLLRADGTMLAASGKRLIAFDPADFPGDVPPPPIAITRVAVGGDRVHPPTGGTPLVLGPDDYALGFEFSALSYVAPAAVRYRYRLEGLDPDWIVADAGRRVANYTTLPPGDYTFRVGAANRFGDWNQAGAAIPITVLPPWWRTPWALATWLVAALVGTTLIVRARTKGLERRALLLEGQISERTREVESQRRTIEAQAADLTRLLETKNRLFANVSHEFRTPLTLIQGPVAEAERAVEDRRLKEQLGQARQSTARLVRLVDQLLDLARLDAGRPVERDPQPLAAFVESQLRAFEQHAVAEGVELGVGVLEPLWVRCGADPLEKILSNLLSNAIKFTPSGGVVTVSVAADGADRVVLEVLDTGIGIPPEERARVFRRFERAMAAGEHLPGTGIGLALVRELVVACDGEVRLDTGKDGIGTRVRVFLPAEPARTTALTPAGGAAARETAALADALRTARAEVSEGGSGPVVLIIEDNAELAAYVVSVLGEGFRFLASGDGKSGLARALEHVPDLVICDAMLPGLDGFEVCERIKADERTSHVPVLMLTARADPDSRLEGFRRHADDYLTKPFRNEELVQRVANILETREILRRRYGKRLYFEARAAEAFPDAEARFMERLRAAIEANYADPEFTAEALASQLAMSTRQLQRKLKAVTDHTPVEYVRAYRLARGRELLQTGQPVGTVALDVGFASQSYFARCYKAHYGENPRDTKGSNGGGRTGRD